MPKRRARRGDGSVGWDRTAQCWVARYPLPTVDGKRRYRKVRCVSETEADAALDRLRRESGRELVSGRTTLGEYLDDWLASHRRTVRASTADSYGNHIRMHIKPLLGGIALHRLRPDDVDRLVADRLRAGKSPATVVRIVTTLRIALGRAVRRRILADNVAALASMPRVERHPVEPLTEADAVAILAAVRDTWVEAIVTLILGSGLRLGEACGLDWGDVHLDDGYVVVRRTKTTPRAVPVSDDAVAALRARRTKARRIGPHEPVFVMQRRARGDRDDRIRPQSVTHALPDILEAAKLPRITPHGLRHGAATLMVSRGVHMRVIAEQLGHRDPSLTARVYAHVVPSQQREAVRSLNRRKDAG